MKKIRTGLLIETMEAAGEAAPKAGIKSSTIKLGACTVTTVDITDPKSAKALEREPGRYVTIEMDKAYNVHDDDFENVTNALADCIKQLAGNSAQGRVLVAGIGNRDITPDSLGPKCVERIVVTRPYEKSAPELIEKGEYANVMAISTNVFGITGIESKELIGGIAKIINPELIIVVDALATSSLNRLCKTIQLSDTPLTPGGGVDNARGKLDFGKGHKIISIGMPTIIDAMTVVINALDKANADKDSIEKAANSALEPYSDSLIAMPTRIDSATDTGAKLIAFAINKALHSDMDTTQILKYLY